MVFHFLDSCDREVVSGGGGEGWMEGGNTPYNRPQWEDNVKRNAFRSTVPQVCCDNTLEMVRYSH